MSERNAALVGVGIGVVTVGVIPFLSCVANSLLQSKGGGSPKGISLKS